MMSSTTPLSTDQTSNNTTPIADELKPLEDKVAYETYQKVLAERKRDQEIARELKHKVDLLEKSKRDLEEETLRKKEDYKTLLDNKMQEYEQTAAELKMMKEQRKQAQKLNAFIEACGNTPIKKNYWKMIPVNDILVHPETGEIDNVSLLETVNAFVRD